MEDTVLGRRSCCDDVQMSSKLLHRFKNMDKLIHYVNLDGRVNAFYSTPAHYVDIKHSLNTSWPLKTDDFFPYADSASAMWTGNP